MPFAETADLVLGPSDKHRWAYACSKLIDEFHAWPVLQGKETPRHRRAPVQHGGTAPDRPIRTAIPNFVKQALSGRPITVFGDGTQSRSFTYVGDVVRALLVLVEHPGAVGEAVQHRKRRGDLHPRPRGEDQGDDRQYVDIVTIPYDQAYEAGFEDMPRRVPDITKYALVRASPTVDLDEILVKVIEFFRTQ